MRVRWGEACSLSEGRRAPGASVDFLTQGLQSGTTLFSPKESADRGAVFRSKARERERSGTSAHACVGGGEQRGKEACPL